MNQGLGAAPAEAWALHSGPGGLVRQWFTEHIGWLHKGAGYLCLAHAALVAIGVHVLANIVGGLGHGENLVLSMVTGTKPLRTRRARPAEATAQAAAVATDIPSHEGLR